MHRVTIARGIDYRQEYTVTECMSVRSFVNIHVGAEFHAPMLCWYHGKPLLRDEWEITLICADVVFTPLPLGPGGGGGKNVMATIGMFVVAALAIAATTLIPGMQIFAVGGALAGWGGFFGGLAGAAIMMGGSLLINAFFPTQMPKVNANTMALEQASPTYSLSITQNMARLGQLIPECYGRNWQRPDLAAQLWAEFIGNEQYIHVLLCLGFGEFHMERIGITDTDIWRDGEYTGNFPEIEIQIVNPGERISLFPDNIETAAEVSGQSLNLETIGPFSANSAGTRASALAFDVIFPRGLGRMNQSGGGQAILAHTVSVRFEYQNIDDYGVPYGEVHIFDQTYTEATQTAQRHTHIVDIPGDGRWQAQGVVTGGGESDPYLLNECVWGGLKAYLPSKLVYPDKTLIAIRARATNSLSQQTARQFYVVHQRKLETWNPTTGWSAPVPTSSWAWAMADMAKSPRWGRRTDRQIDLHALYRLDQELAARGDEFNQVVDTRQRVWGQLTESCRCVRVLPRPIFSTISWMREGPGRPAVAQFTPYNIIRGSFSFTCKHFTDDSPDDVNIKYRDQNGWMERDVRAAMPDYP